MLGGLGQTSLEVSIPAVGVGAGCGVASAFFFLPPYAEFGEASPTASKITSAASVIPLRFDLRGSPDIFLISCFGLPHVNSVLVAVVAERHIVLLVLHEQARLCRRVWLMAAQAS